MKARVFSISGDLKREVELPENIFDVKVNPHLLWLAVRYYSSRKRRGTASTKTRGEVRGGGRKPWRQKGLGRARHGSIRSPIWRGGGVTFGPKPRDFSIDMPYKARIKALFGALSDRVKEDKIKIIEGIESIENKTKEGEKVIKNLKLSGEKVLLLFSDGERDKFLAFRNLEKVEYKRALDVNAFDILKTNYVIFSEKGFEEFVNLRGGNKDAG